MQRRWNYRSSLGIGQKRVGLEFLKGLGRRAVGAGLAIAVVTGQGAAWAALPSPPDDPDLKAAWQQYQQEHFPQAARSYEKAAKRGQPIGEYNYAMMLINGQGVRKDPARGRVWLRRAAESGLAQAQYDEGLLYENGLGVAKSQPDAVHWYQLAAQQGHSEAQMTLATQYFLGRGVAQDYVQAAKWYESAAEGGIEAAQYIIASCYEHGDGVAPDVDKAIYWYIQASLQGDSAAADKARVLQESLREARPS